ncbi:hypothetical protein [Marinagarivorans algicola]|uniref:hypothetical protein n=1 Tax=Marinagarivorans algicola TaxID=1513270 RepID=UPI003736C6D2
MWWVSLYYDFDWYINAALVKAKKAGKTIDYERLGDLYVPQTTNTAFHAEFWVTENEDIVFCEIASRTGGAMIPFLFKDNFGLDLDKQWLLAECNLSSPIDYNYNQGGWITVQPQVGLLKSLPKEPEPEFIISSFYTGNAGMKFDGAIKSGLFLAGFVVKGTNSDEVSEKLKSAADWFLQNCLWEKSIVNN